MIEQKVLGVPDAVLQVFKPNSPSLAYYAPMANGAGIAELENQVAQRAPSVSDTRVVRVGSLHPSQILDAISAQPKTILLSADPVLTGRSGFQEITKHFEDILTSSRYHVSLLLAEKATLARPFVRDSVRNEQGEVILVKGHVIKDTLLCNRIMNLLDTHFGSVDSSSRTAFNSQLEVLLRHAPSDGLKDFVIDPQSGLRFYPVAKDHIDWAAYAEGLPRPSKTYSRNPAAFLLEQYSDYIQAGLLYSGHLHIVDPKLYNSLRKWCVGSRTFQSIDEFFGHHNILTSADLTSPSPDVAARVATVKAVNLVLAGQKAVEGQLATHRHRRNTPRAIESRNSH
ncbi:MAG: hypothetical protein QOJ86_3190 [Bradyrhizobium sp.]|nr:hypothetical protein [Bradyrhizobium sp.]